MAEYVAADVAACIIKYANELEKPVSNLQLQKMLFFCQCEYLKTHGAPLFDDDIVAWQYGPVVKSVYRMYSYRGASPIRKVERPLRSLISNSYANIKELEGDALAIVQATVRKWIYRPAWDMVSQSHRVGGAWDSIYNSRGKGSGYDDVIPKELMKNEAA